MTHCEKTVKDSAASKVDGELKPESVGKQTDATTVKTEEEKMSADGFSVAELKLLQERAEKHAFQAEVNSLMKIIINSLYSNTEIFLREVISNASDALDKIRYLSLTDKTQLRHEDKLEIRVRADPDKNALVITDTGVGMTKKDLIDNLGTIAQSGTSQFLTKFKEAGGDMSLIGQFGVGFYSVFLVADSVTVVTKNNDDKQWVWQSDSNGAFTVAEDPRGSTLKRGTEITLHLKEDALDFAKHETLKALIQKYSQFINYPIYLWTSSEESKEVPLTPEEIEEKQKEKEKKKEDQDEEVVSLDEEKKDDAAADDSATTKTVKETVWQWELINTTKPVWMRPAKETSDDDYKDFYHTLTKDTNDPLFWSHFNAEGEVNFKSVLYIPAAPPQNMWDPAYDLHKGIKLYVRRVFITDEFQDILPKYMGFIRGVVDSDDLPLNVSREMLQEHKLLKVIKKKLTRKAIAMIQELADSLKPAKDDEGNEIPIDEKKKQQFNDFYNKYHTNIKLGIIEDTSNRIRLSKLLRYYSSKSPEEMSTLEDYVSRMKEGQKDIYYLAGHSRDIVEKSPLLENLVNKGYEVIYCTDPIDEYALTHMDKFDGKYKIINASREGLKIGETDEDHQKEEKAKWQMLSEFLTKNLSGKINKAVPSGRLTTSPSALVAGSSGYTANMERIMKAQAVTAPAGGTMTKTLEYNTRHPVIKELFARVQQDPNDQTAKDIAILIYETAALTSGYIIDDAKEFATHINRMLAMSLGVDPNAQVDPEPIPEPKAAKTTNTEAKASDNKDEL